MKRIKKFTLLRKLKKENFDIKEIYDENDESKLKKFDEMNLIDITDYYQKKVINIESEFINEGDTGGLISDGVDKTIRKLREKPVIGYDIGINALNYIIYGLRTSTYYIISSYSGYGKTRFQAYCSLQLGYKQQIPCLFITTESKKDEIHTMMLAHLSNINEKKILMNDLTYNEELKLDEAKEEFKKAKIYHEYIPDFSLEKIEHLIKRYIINYGIVYCFFDYIKETISMMEDINNKTGNKEGWKSLVLFSERLEKICKKYKIGILTSTQLNKEGYTQGAKDIVNTADVWCVINVPTDDDKQKFNLFPIEENYFINCIDVKKNRRGEKDCKIFLNVDLGKLDYQEILVTQNDKSITIPKISFE